MRKGPRPLSVHMTLAAGSLADLHAQQNTGDSQAQNDMAAMLRGIQLYQSWPHAPQRLPLEHIWREGEATISRPSGEKDIQGAPVLLLVPSMINRAYILDLMEQRSLLRWLRRWGINAVLFDWGEPVHDPAQQSVEDCVLRRLVPALRAMAERTGGPVHVLGYCMGGTLSLAAALAAPECVRSLILLAAPWDFHAGPGRLLSRVRNMAPQAFPAMQEKGLLPVDWMQGVFAALDPLSTVRKFSDFAAMDQNSDEAHLFVAVEDWLDDGVDLPSSVAGQAIGEWFLNNQTGQGQWSVGGAPVDPSALSCPALIIASDKDRLVEYETALALREIIPNSSVCNPSCGHIGMIAGGAAVDTVWARIAGWAHQSA